MCYRKIGIDSFSGSRKFAGKKRKRMIFKRHEGGNTRRFGYFLPKEECVD